MFPSPGSAAMAAIKPSAVTTHSSNIVKELAVLPLSHNEAKLFWTVKLVSSNVACPVEDLPKNTFVPGLVAECTKNRLNTSGGPFHKVHPLLCAARPGAQD